MSAVATVTSSICPQAETAIAVLDGGGLDRLREIIEAILAYLAWGGVALALGASLVFILTWVVSHLRTPRQAGEEEATRLLPYLALLVSFAPVGLTLVAAIGRYFPGMLPFILKIFGVAVLVAAISWIVSVVAIVVGGDREDLRRARRAILLAGTPWYCLAIYLATML